MVKIKNINVRCNKEYAPYQHVRIELSATLDKEDNVQESRSLLADEAELLLNEVISKLVRVQATTSPSDATENDNVSY